MLNAIYRLLDVKTFFAFKKVSRAQVLSSLLSVSVLMLVLGCLWLGQFLPENTPEKIEIREISVAMPPPPPPAPPVQQEVVETTLSVEIKGSGAVLPKIKLKNTIAQIKPDVPTIKNTQSKWQALTVDWDSFNLDQLDALPKLLTPIRIKIPKRLRRQGIEHVVIKLDIVIDPQGQVSLIEIIDNPYPELVNEIHSLVRNSRFTAPSKDNEAVSVRFIWPVEIKS